MDVTKQGFGVVYVTQETQFDFSPAERYGKIEFVTVDDMNNTRGSLHNEALVRDIRMKMHKYDEEQDFIIIAGSPYVAALVFAVLGKKGITQVRFLRWSNRDREYTPVTINLDQRG